ncbi:MAG: hypothetical protein M3N21_02955 [Actinomycetota bacterium]|nr:hypothetical protein [Actinomycetota bacterium]
MRMAARAQRRAFGGGLVLALAVVSGLAQAAPAPARLTFAPSVRLTQPNLGGFEPSIVVDRYGNVYVTAHKQRQINVVAPDSLTGTGVRTASFLWTSSDGRHFHDLTPDQSYVMNFGDEGEIALDGADHLYMVDTNVTDVTFARWHITGLGKQVLEDARPAIGTAQPVDDRPWVAANAAGDVLYIANAGASPVNAASASADGGGSGPGRFTAYVSHDRGHTFPTQGVTLKDSGWCYPAADPRPGSRTFYVACIDNDVNTPDQAYDHAVRLFTTTNAGLSWSRQVIGHYQSATWPSIKVASDGTVHVLVGDTLTTAKGTTGALRLFSGRLGQTMRERLLPTVGDHIPFAWLAVAPNGAVAAAYYAQRDAATPWYVHADVVGPTGTISTGQIGDVPLAPANGNPKGDFFEATFGPTNKLYVAYTALNQEPVSAAGLGTDVYVAHQR